MYRVLLVDDEPLGIEALMIMIDWASLGFEICGVCENGIEALQAIEDYAPDIIVTDIEMPIMNGLDLIEQSKLQGKQDIIFIVLSGYSQFEYTRRALAYGVHHYLLKPIMDTEATELLTGVYDILERRQDQSDIAKFAQRTQLERNLTDLVNGDIDERDDHKFNELALLSGHASRWFCIRFLVEVTACMGLREAVKRCIEGQEQIIMIDSDTYSFGIIYGLQASEDIRQVMDSLLLSIQEQTGVRFSMSIGRLTDDLRKIGESYKDALQASAYLFFMKGHPIVYYEDIMNHGIRYDPSMLSKSTSILHMLECANPTLLQKEIDEVFHEFQSNWTSPAITIMFIHHIVYQSFLILQELGQSFEGHEQLSLHDLLKPTYSLQDMKHWLMEYCREFQQRFNDIRDYKAGGILEQAKIYITENYLEPITIKDLANQYYLHPVYLGKAFKDRYGIGIQEYVNNLRIDEAVRMFKETDHKASQISERVGYGSYSQFLKYFERRMGHKPGDV
ncbi:response regulator [Paenibacillus sp. FA6]|uniref:response regulator n=1 Tax=Paenibacillus sp. FA6 TaxID=3413029 RepID=UPI003F654E91